MLEVKNISFSYNDILTIDDVSLEVHAGEILGILGPNGAGKSTLIKLMNGILKTTSGSIDIEGHSISEISLREKARTIATLTQGASAPFGFTSLEIVLMGRTPYVGALGFETKRDIEIAREAMRKTDCLKFADRNACELSGGEKQRVLLARALAQKPKLLMLDEPTTFLDIKHILELKKLIRTLNGEGITFICALHDINLASTLCDRLAFLVNGRIQVAGSPKEVLSKSTIDKIFGVDVEMGSNSRGAPTVLI